MKANSTNPIFELYNVTESSTRKVHLRRLNDILHLCLERGDLSRALRAWTILSTCKEFDWITKWRTGLYLLSHGTTHDTHRENSRSLEFLKKLMRHHPEQQEVILQEIILVLADLGKFKEALDEIDLYLPSFPYQDNPALHTYAGLITLMLSKSSSYTESKSLTRQAKDHFSRTLALDPDNSIARSFFEETCKELNNPTRPEEENSEEEMDLDGIRSPKRARGHTSA